MKTILFLSTFFFALTCAFNTANAQAPDYKWAINAIGTGDDRGFKIAADDNGNIIVTGRFHSKEIQFGDIKLINSDQDSSTADIFIVKYSAEAKVLWARSIGGFGDEFGTDCSTDSKGNIIFIGGYDAEQINIGNYTFNNKTVKGEGSDILIIKYSPDGKIIWAKSIGGAKHDGGYATCAIDKEENIYVTGQFYSDKFMIDSLELTKSKIRGADIFLAKLSSKGKLLWAKSSHGPNTFDSETQSCSVDTQGNIIISGCFGGPYIAFDKYTLKKNVEKTNNIFVTKYSSTGKLIWANSYGGSIATSRIDGEGNIFLAGMYSDSVLSIGNIRLYNNGEGNLLIAKLNPEGKVLWAKSAGGKGFAAVRNFCMDSKGNAIITGTFNSPIWTLGNTTLTKDTTSLTSKNEERTEDMYIASYSKNGDVLWAICAGGKGRNAGRSCVADKEGNIYWTGSFDVNKLVIGSLTLTNSGDSDIFIIKLSQKR
jgi:hypothetical protein